MIAILIGIAALAIAAYIAYRMNPVFLMPLHKSLALWSQRANVVITLLITYVVQQNGAPVAALTAYLPASMEPIKGMLSGLVAFMALSLLRLLPQSKPNA